VSILDFLLIIGSVAVCICQRRRENASARRSNNASGTNTRRPRGAFWCFGQMEAPQGARLARSV